MTKPPRKKGPVVLRVVKGKRATTKGKPVLDQPHRIVFVPRGDGTFFCICSQTNLSVELLESVEVTVPERIVSFLKLGE